MMAAARWSSATKLRSSPGVHRRVHRAIAPARPWRGRWCAACPGCSRSRRLAGVDVEHPGPVQRFAHRVHQRPSQPRAALALVDALQGAAQRVFADDFVHAQGLRGHRVAAQRGDVRVAAVAGQQAQHQRAEHVALVGRVVAAVGQRAARDPALEHAGGGQELGEEHQLAVRRGRRAFVPAHVHAPTQRVHYLRPTGARARFNHSTLLPAFALTHRVSVPTARRATPALAQRAIKRRQLPFSGYCSRPCKTLPTRTNARSAGGTPIARSPGIDSNEYRFLGVLESASDGHRRLFRARPDSMIDMRHPRVAVRATRMPWAAIEAALARVLAHKDRSGRLVQDADTPVSLQALRPARAVRRGVGAATTAARWRLAGDAFALPLADDAAGRPRVMSASVAPSRALK